jgi:nucleoside 2-deoxyribosyltransferase
MKKCFISAPAVVNLRPIIDVVKSLGIEPILPLEMPMQGRSFTEQILKAINLADFCIAVIDTKSSSSNVLFEIGYATAQKKRILVIAPRGADIPQVLENYFITRADLTKPQGLEFTIQQLLHAPKSPDNKKLHKIQKTRKISDKAAETVRALERLGDHATEREVVNVLTNSLQKSGIKVLVEDRATERLMDIALWVDELDAMIGNPIGIEVKRHLSLRSARLLREQVLTYSSASSRALLVVYITGNEQLLDTLNLPSPLIVFVKLQKLLSLLQENTFANIVRQFRNQIVHGGQ